MITYTSRPNTRLILKESQHNHAPRDVSLTHDSGHHNLQVPRHQHHAAGAREDGDAGTQQTEEQEPVVHPLVGVPARHMKLIDLHARVVAGPAHVHRHAAPPTDVGARPVGKGDLLIDVQVTRLERAHDAAARERPVGARDVGPEHRGRGAGDGVLGAQTIAAGRQQGGLQTMGRAEEAADDGRGDEGAVEATCSAEVLELAESEVLDDVELELGRKTEDVGCSWSGFCLFVVHVGWTL